MDYDELFTNVFFNHKISQIYTKYFSPNFHYFFVKKKHQKKTITYLESIFFFGFQNGFHKCVDFLFDLTQQHIPIRQFF